MLFVNVLEIIVIRLWVNALSVSPSDSGSASVAFDTERRLTNRIARRIRYIRSTRKSLFTCLTGFMRV